jgi:hypothetical protein
MAGQASRRRRRKWRIGAGRRLCSALSLHDTHDELGLDPAHDPAIAMFASAARTLVFLLALGRAADALHFYLDASEHRCFIEELPTDTVVEGPSAALAGLRVGSDGSCARRALPRA